MTKQVDSLVEVEGPDRVNYKTGVLLNADDFVAEQNYHRGRLARALTSVNGSGTLAGLKVVHEEEQLATDEQAGSPERIVIEPGIAIDRLGRLIEVPSKLCVRLNQWYEQQAPLDLRQSWNAAGALAPDAVAGVTVDVFIRFATCERGRKPSFACGPFDSIDAVTAARLRDGFETELLLRKEAAPGVPLNSWPDLASVAESERPQQLRDAIFSAWESGSVADNLMGLNPLPEHAAGQDTTSLLLARMVIPADEATGDSRPQRRLTDAVQLHNDLRPFVLTTNALARLLGFNINLSAGS
jgi:hypothetical protein